MEDKNIRINLQIKQLNQSNILGYDERYISGSSNYNFALLDNAYKDTGKVYAKLKTSIQNNDCMQPGCKQETEALKNLMNAPQMSLDFLANLTSQLTVTDDNYYDVNQDYRYMLANAIMNGKPGFDINSGYEVVLQLLPDGSQQIFFDGPMFEEALIINSASLEALLESGTNIVAETPDINKDMLRLLGEVGVMGAGSINPETGQLTPRAKISEDFVLKYSDGTFDYEIIDIGGGKGRNILKYDLDKIERKVTPFINAEVSGLLANEQEAVAAWNVFIGRMSTTEEDDQMVQNANAGSLSWNYNEVLPLSQRNKEIFMLKYRNYFFHNYLKQFTTNQIPTVTADAAVFDLSEGKEKQADEFLKRNPAN